MCRYQSANQSKRPEDRAVGALPPTSATPPRPHRDRRRWKIEDEPAPSLLVCSAPGSRRMMPHARQLAASVTVAFSQASLATR